ncbi:hypothetical protein M9H77_06819 [Catharanthus roseus]|uniref:Uncharacterized protein n=1 Tax=Catharanthus roseus TaxID=4058 RepID=A0ACC0BTF2_CATRO|nr:hypothetical protein M9H77_06819 [Catharanthus roseus]
METMVGMLTEEVTMEMDISRRSQMGIGKFHSCPKTVDHIPYDDCCENSPYDVHKEYHGSHDYSDQSCGEVVEHLQYVLTSLDPYLMGFVEHNLVEKSLLLVNGLIEKSCQRLIFQIVEIAFKTLFEKAFGFKFFHFH